MGSAKSQRGASMVELAVITPLLVILLFGFIELGRALVQTNALTKAVNTGVRYVAREPDAVTPACGQGATWAAATTQAAQIVAYIDADGGNTTLLLPGLDDAGAVTFSVREETGGSLGTLSVCVIRVDASAQFGAIFGDSIVPMLNLGPITLGAFSEERYIGE